MDEQTSEVLLTFAELAVGFAGFSSLVSIYSSAGLRTWPPVVRFRLRFLLENSLYLLFFSILPFPVFATGLPVDLVWMGLSLALGTAYFITQALLQVRLTRLSAQARGELNRGLVLLFRYLAPVVATLLLLGATGALPVPPAAIYQLALFGVLGSMAAVFFAFVTSIDRTGHAD